MSRTETFEATRPDGEVVVIERDLDTGEQTATLRGEFPPLVVTRKPRATVTK